MVRCNQKYRDKNGNIIGYTLYDTITGKSINVSATELKMKIKSKDITISNLTLTSDGRLIDSDDSKNIEIETKNRNRIYNEYSNGENQNKVNYALSKVNSHRVGKLVTRALLLGLTCASLASITTGCGTSQPLDVNAAQTQEIVQTLTLDEKIDLLNNATTINIDVKNFTINSKAVISVDGTDIGSLEGKFVKLFETLKFVDDENNIIAIGDQDAHLMFDGWTIQDKDGNVLFSMKENFNLFVKKYSIYDTNGNEIGYLKADFFTFANKSGNIYDTDGNVIAKISQLPFCNDFKIEIVDNSKIDNTSLTVISVDYMMKAIQDAKKESRRSRSDGD